MHQLLFVYRSAADKRGACSLLAQAPEATLPIPKDGNLLEEITDTEYEF